MQLLKHLWNPGYLFKCLSRRLQLVFLCFGLLIFFTLVTLVEMGEVFRVVYLFEAATWSYKKGS